MSQSTSQEGGVKLTNEPTARDGSPRRFAGMHRPPLETYATGGYIMCSCGMVLQTLAQGREHWQLGHFDYPLYYEEES